MVELATATLISLHNEPFFFAWSKEWLENVLHVFRAKHESAATKRKLHQEFWSA